MKIQIIKVIMKKLLKTALYARCASKEENKPSPVESQLKELREACKDSQIVKEYVDEAENGVDLNRSGLRRLLKDAKKGLFGTLYVFDPDRLSRNYAQLLQILKELEKNGVKVNFLRGGGPELQFQLMLCNSMAEYEK